MGGRIRKAAAATAVALSAACADGPTGPEPLPVSGFAPVMAAPADATPVEGRWIVVLRAETGAVAAVARDALDRSGGVGHVAFDASVRGFVASLEEGELERLRRDPRVAYIEQDMLLRATGTQTNAPWGLDRIGQRGLPLNGSYTWAQSGTGVHAYVIDSGIRLTHEEFGGRASSGFDAIDGGAAEDCNGHGTHVAGTLGGRTYGVAKSVTLVAVRVLDCGGVGTTSSVIAGVDWVTAHHVKPAVANLSLAGAGSRALDEAIERSIAAGVTYVVAAGNDARDACAYSPARVPAAVTVGASTPTDAIWSLSNTGACLDVFAPGADIPSASHAGDASAITMSGTSMAAPHAAGVVALYLEANPEARPADVAAVLSGSATRPAAGARASSPAAPERLLFASQSEAWWRQWRDRWIGVGQDCSVCAHMDRESAARAS